MTSKEYWDEIESIASGLIKKQQELSADEELERGYIEDAINDLLHEITDGHRWVIYNAYHFSVLEHSENAEYGVTEGLIDCADDIKAGGLHKLLMSMCYWAMYADIYDRVRDKLDDADEQKREEAKV